MVDPLLQCVLFMLDLVVYDGSAATVCVIYVLDLVVYDGSAATVCVIYV